MNQKFVKYYDLMRKAQRLEMLKNDKKQSSKSTSMKKVRKR